MSPTESRTRTAHSAATTAAAPHVMTPIMSPDTPKSDRELWARGEIERLREALRDAFASRRSLAQDSALASDAVLGYFNRHPEAGEAPLSHHRDGIAKAVIRALSYEPHEPE